METTVKERLIQFLAVKRISQGAFEKKCGLANGFVSSIRKSVSNKIIPQSSRLTDKDTPGRHPVFLRYTNKKVWQK